ncbi:macro domain-containing protein VPA0103 [Telopea speciosissima]|uniref:macro domain-containing protein VPA0103 n=1 Tax=Telopea speciosissima TaxID=54955 RepID=UPI001CC4585E|nr:macro domain-containing protein VPA0103 [Telopea speciosissima]
MLCSSMLNRGVWFLPNRNLSYRTISTIASVFSFRSHKSFILVKPVEFCTSIRFGLEKREIARVQQNSSFSSSSSDSRGGSITARVLMASNGGLDKLGVSHFALSPTSVLKIQKGDITQWSIDTSSDAIVNAANKRMLGGGGVDGAIHRAAGPELRAACYEVPEVRPGVRCPIGEARITPAFRLPVSRVIHTVGPIYDVDDHPELSLRNAYRNSLRLAKENNIQFIAFPAISCGVYRYPYEEAATIALSVAKEFANDFKEVHFVLFSDDVYKVWLDKAAELL